jgi:Na+/H+-translocating membrane pyrophosphatase
MYAFTQDNAGGPIIQYVDDGLVPTEPSVDAAGNPTRAGLIGYMIAYAFAFAALAYFLLI